MRNCLRHAPLLLIFATALILTGLLVAPDSPATVAYGTRICSRKFANNNENLTPTQRQDTQRADSLTLISTASKVKPPEAPPNSAPAAFHGLCKVRVHCTLNGEPITNSQVYFYASSSPANSDESDDGGCGSVIGQAEAQEESDEDDAIQLISSTGVIEAKPLAPGVISVEVEGVDDDSYGFAKFSILEPGEHDVNVDLERYTRVTGRCLLKGWQDCFLELHINPVSLNIPFDDNSLTIDLNGSEQVFEGDLLPGEYLATLQLPQFDRAEVVASQRLIVTSRVREQIPDIEFDLSCKKLFCVSGQLKIANGATLLSDIYIERLVKAQGAEFWQLEAYSDTELFENWFAKPGQYRLCANFCFYDEPWRFNFTIEEQTSKLDLGTLTASLSPAPVKIGFQRGVGFEDQRMLTVYLEDSENTTSFNLYPGQNTYKDVLVKPGEYQLTVIEKTRNRVKTRFSEQIIEAENDKVFQLDADREFCDVTINCNSIDTSVSHKLKVKLTPLHTEDLIQPHTRTIVIDGETTSASKLLPSGDYLAELKPLGLKKVVSITPEMGTIEFDSKDRCKLNVKLNKSSSEQEYATHELLLVSETKQLIRGPILGSSSATHSNLPAGKATAFIEVFNNGYHYYSKHEVNLDPEKPEDISVSIPIAKEFENPNLKLQFVVGNHSGTEETTIILLFRGKDYTVRLENFGPFIEIADHYVPPGTYEVTAYQVTGARPEINESVKKQIIQSEFVVHANKPTTLIVRN